MATLILRKAPPALAALLGTSYTLEDMTTIGFSHETTLPFPMQGGGLSALHIHLRRRSGGKYQIEDAKSRSGTVVNGQTLEPGKRYSIRNGALIRIGLYEFEYVADADSVTAEAASLKPDATMGTTISLGGAKKPEPKKVEAKKPEVSKAEVPKVEVKKPEVKAEVKKPEVKAEVKKPEVKKPEVKAEVKKPPVPPPPPPKPEAPEPPREVVVQRLSEWLARCEEAPYNLDRDVYEEAAALCGTTFYRADPRHHAVAEAWCHAFMDAPRVTALPLALPYLIDLGALVALRLPRLRTVKPRGYFLEYVERHLGGLGHLPGINFIRRQVSPVTKQSVQRPIVVRFINEIFAWVVDAWLDVTCGTDTAARERELEACTGPVRVLTGPRDVQEFLIQLSAVITRTRAFATVLKPLDKFLLGAAAHVPDALTNFDAVLIHECLRSQAVEDQEYDPRPLHRRPIRAAQPSRDPGAHGSVRSVRKTNRVEELSSVIPQDLALAQVEGDGVRLLADQLVNEGLLVWERQDYEQEEDRESVLVCFVADVSAQAQVAVGGETAANTPSVHARRLIFECLRDMALIVEPPRRGLDVRVFLEPGRDRPERRRAWQVDFDDFRTRVGKTLYDDMVSLEALAPGYYFPDHATAVPKGDHHEFIEGVFDRCEYDQTVVVFLGPTATLRDLTPAQPPPARKQDGARDTIYLVELGRWPDAVELAHGRQFADLRTEADFEFTPDEEFRYALLEELIGPPRGAREVPFDLEPEPGAPA